MKMLPVVILAGGLGKRIQNISRQVPKALIPILGKPFLEWKLRELENQGVHEVHILLGYQSSLINDFLQDFNSTISLSLHYESEGLLGTAGAIRLHLEKLPDTFILTYGDNLLSLRLRELVEVFNNLDGPLMAITDQLGPNEIYNVNSQEGKIVQYTKSGDVFCEYIDYGYTIFRKADFTKVVLGQSADLAQLIRELVEVRKMYSFKTNLRYHEIGTPEGLKETESWIRAMHQELPVTPQSGY
jgi:NDP-sugar pyrophosphorylase family protein